MKNIPNLLTLSRIALIAAIYLALQLDGAHSYWLAVGFYTLAALSDFLDGWLARKMHHISAFGQMLDPIADKLMVAAVLVMLIANYTLSGWHIIAVLIILLREIFVSGLREYLTQSNIELPVSPMAKIKTAVQMIALGFLLSGPAGVAVLAQAHLIGLALLWLAAVLTLYTGYDYLRIGLKHAKW